MVVSGHVVEEEVLLAQIVGLTLADLVLVAWSQTVILPSDAEALEDLDHGVLESDTLVLVH